MPETKPAQPVVLSQTNLFDFLVKDDEITWQSILTDAVKDGNLDPWDIDIGKLAEQFLKMLYELKEMNFSISGKVILAAAIMLKLKSSKFINDDIANLDRIIADTQNTDESYDDDDTDYEELATQPGYTVVNPDEMPLFPRTPQARRRKVSMQDLVEALNKALEVTNRRKVLLARPAPAVHAPTNVVDISELIELVHKKIEDHYQAKQQEKLYFSYLVGNEPTRRTKIQTFVPLLHLSNARKVMLEQPESFSDFSINMRDPADAIALDIDVKKTEKSTTDEKGQKKLPQA